MSEIASYRDLQVWRKGVDLSLEIYSLTKTFPREESYGLVSQMRRAAVSIPSNIAEGRRRGTRKDFRQFLFIAFGSVAELETQIEIVKHLPYGEPERYANVERMLEEIGKMLNAFIARLSE